MEDTAIVELYWARDQRAITASDEKYGGLCRGLSFNILASREDAEECVNDTWHRWRSGRARKRGEGLEQLVLELEDCVPAGPSAEEAWEARETAAAIDRWLDTLSREDRTAFVGRYWYGERVDRLAGRFGRSPNWMAQRLRRLRAGLRRALEQEGVCL